MQLDTNTHILNFHEITLLLANWYKGYRLASVKGLVQSLQSIEMTYSGHIAFPQEVAWALKVAGHLQRIKKWIFISNDTLIERAWVGPSYIKIRANSSRRFESYGRNCEHVKLRRVCATCRVIEEWESAQKSSLSHVKNYSHPRRGRWWLDIAARMLRGGLGFEFSGATWAHG